MILIGSNTATGGTMITVQQLRERLDRMPGHTLVAVLDEDGDASEAYDVVDHGDYVVIKADKDRA